MSTLRQLAEKHGTDKAEHGYMAHYAPHLWPLYYEPVVLGEIGVARGGSLRMWRDWFQRGRVIGIDKNPNAMIEGEPRITTIRADAAIPATWRGFTPTPDVIIDDGSHLCEEVVGAWTHAWPVLKPGGWYVIEDLAAQFCTEFGARAEGLDEGSTATDLIDALAHHVMRGGMAAEVHVYREIAFIRKAGG